MQHILPIVNKNAHTCEKSLIEFDEKENIQDNFIHILTFFTRKNSQERKLISYGDF